MLKDFFTLALQSTLRKKRSSLLVFLVLLFSFSCAITTLSLTKSISDTNAEFRLNTYGEWYVAAVRSNETDGEWLTSQSWARKTAHNKYYDYENISSSGVPGSIGIIDPTVFDMARTEMLEGHLPKKTGEVALSEKVLKDIESFVEEEAKAYGIELDEPVKLNVGDSFKLPIRFMEELAASDSEGNSKDFGVSKDFTCTLCGVFEDFGDLWATSYGADIKIAVTEETIAEFYKSVEKWYQREKPDYRPVEPIPFEQYYIEVDRNDRIQAKNDVWNHEFAFLDNSHRQWVDINVSAYPLGQEIIADEELYSYLVAVVALIAIICVYILQLSEQVHSFAVLRSIGITKKQLLLLAFIESMILAIPAMVLGIPLGALLTKLALQLSMYSGSVAVQVAIPYGMLWKLFLLWIGIILFSRLVIFLITIRTPLTGRMQMSTSTAKKSRILRTATIALMLLIFSTATAFSVSSGARPKYILEWNSTVPDYKITGSARSPLTPEKVELIASIPGITQVEAFMQGHTPGALDVGTNQETLLMTYTGVERKPVSYYYMLDENYWDDVFHFGEYKEAFHNGDVVFLLFGGNNALYEFVYGELPEEIYPAEGEKITLFAKSREGFVVAEDSVDVVVKQIPPDVDNYCRSYGVFESNTIVFSEAFFKKFVSKISPKVAEWGNNLGKGPYGLGGVCATADINSDDLSAGVALEAFCKSNNLGLINNHDRLMATRQDSTQELIKLFACGGCVVLVALLLFGGALSLEAESEKRSYSILRAIGMSRRQVRRKVFSKALVRSVLAVACGWVLTFGLGVWKSLQSLSEPTLAKAFSSYFYGLKYYRFGVDKILPISAVCIIVLLAVSVMVKRRLWKKQFSIKE